MAKIYRVVPEQVYERYFGGKEVEKVEYFENLFPPKIENKAKRLLTALAQVPEFSWKNSGEIIYKGETIPRSHIVDLVLLSFKSILPKKLNNAGLKEYLLAINNSNVPRDILSSKFKELLIGSNNSWTTFEKWHKEDRK